MSAATTPPRAVAPRTGGALLATCAVLCLLVSAAVQATALATPLLTLHVFDSVLQSRNMDTLWLLGVGFAVLALFGGMLRHLRASLLAGMTERIWRRLQLRALSASVRSPLLGDKQRGDAALQDAAEVRRMLGGSLAADLLDLLFIPAALAFLYALHPLFFAVGLAACLLKAFIALLGDRTTRGLVAASASASTRTLSKLGGQLRQQDLLIGLGMLPAVMRRWTPHHLHAVEALDAAQRRGSAVRALMTTVTNSAQVGIVAVGAWLLVEREISPGAMFAAAMVMSLASGPVAGIAARWRDWAFGMTAWRRLRALTRSAAAPSPTPADPHAPAGLAIEGLCLRHPGAPRQLLQKLTLNVAPGEFWAILGPNGTGKTTLLRAVLGLVVPEAGRVMLDGQDTHRADRETLGAGIGYLPQDAQLMEGSVMDNVARFGAGNAASAVAAARRAGAHEAIGRLPRGYESPAGSSAGLSGGQRRLVALARALHGSPRLLVLDEPEAGLDAAARAALRDAVAASRAEGAVVLIVTHAPAPWADMLDGVLRRAGDGTWEAKRSDESPAAAPPLALPPVGMSGIASA